MSTIIITNNTVNDIAITDLRSFEVTASGTETLSNYFNDVEISNSNDLIGMIADSTFTVNNGVEDLNSTAAAKYCLGHYSDVNLAEEYRDRSGKLRVHQTSRKLGMRIMWTGVGDDPTDPDKVGGGASFSLTHEIDESEPLVKYIDFNMVNNETWLHEGYLTWDGADLDILSLEMVPRVTKVATSSGTNYNLYGGYLVVPTYPGTGTIDITSDITTHSGGLIYMPDNDLGESPTAYWNADWNASTEEYENITPAYSGDGRYNMFSVEVTFAKFLNNIPLLASGFIALNSSDTDQIGHGMRLKMTADTNDGVQDHAWSIACIMCLHRERSV